MLVQTILKSLNFKLLNEKNDDDDEEARIGLKKSNELLQKLLKNQDEEKKQKEPSVIKLLSYPCFLSNYLFSANIESNHFVYDNKNRVMIIS